jgi:hypothetical protein
MVVKRDPVQSADWAWCIECVLQFNRQRIVHLQQLAAALQRSVTQGQLRAGTVTDVIRHAVLDSQLLASFGIWVEQGAGVSF